MRMRARTWPLVAGAAALLTFLILAVAIIAAISGSGGCNAPSGGPPSKEAERDIPADFLELYQQVGAKYRIPWEVLAGIGREECDHGRLDHPACTPQPGASGPGTANFAGAAGPMQIGIGGAAGNIWAVRKTDGGGAHLYSSGANPVADSSGCAGDGDLAYTGAKGDVTVAPGADRPGATTKPIVLRYLAAMAGLAGRPIVLTTGTNHSQFTVDGNVSDHWAGYAADLGMVANGGTDDGPVGDTLMTACLVLAGVPPDRARSQAVAGGLYTLDHNGLRIQCIWKTNAGGNHHNHVHVGVRPI
jgi:hypothetical protein